MSADKCQDWILLSQLDYSYNIYQLQIMSVNDPLDHVENSGQGGENIHHSNNLQAQIQAPLPRQEAPREQQHKAENQPTESTAQNVVPATKVQLQPNLTEHQKEEKSQEQHPRQIEHQVVVQQEPKLIQAQLDQSKPQSSSVPANVEISVPKNVEEQHQHEEAIHHQEIQHHEQPHQNQQPPIKVHHEQVHHQQHQPQPHQQQHPQPQPEGHHQPNENHQFQHQHPQHPEAQNLVDHSHQAPQEPKQHKEHKQHEASRQQENPLHQQSKEENREAHKPQHNPEPESLKEEERKVQIPQRQVVHIEQKDQQQKKQESKKETKQEEKPKHEHHHQIQKAQPEHGHVNKELDKSKEVIVHHTQQVVVAKVTKEQKLQRQLQRPPQEGQEFISKMPNFTQSQLEQNSPNNYRPREKSEARNLKVNDKRQKPKGEQEPSKPEKPCECQIM